MNALTRMVMEIRKTKTKRKIRRKNLNRIMARLEEVEAMGREVERHLK
jgi:hypothetical protein